MKTTHPPLLFIDNDASFVQTNPDVHLLYILDIWYYYYTHSFLLLFFRYILFRDLSAHVTQTIFILVVKPNITMSKKKEEETSGL